MSTYNDATNVSTGKPKAGGAVFTAPLGTTLPTTASADLGTEFDCLGYCSDDGLKNDISHSSTDIKAWGGDTVQTLQDSKNDDFKLKLIEVLRKSVLETVYNKANVSGDISTGLTIRVNPMEHEARVWVIDMIMTNGTLKRVVIPNAKISTIAEISYKDNEATGYDLTLKALASTAIDGDTHREYLLAPEKEEP